MGLKKRHFKKRGAFRFRNRKAQAVESQFNWIFILIVGAVIMAFFVFIVVKQKAASEAKFSGKVTKQLNTVLVGAKVSSGTYQEIPIPEVSIRFECNDYYIGPASQRLGNRVVFAPTFLEGAKIITWTLDWNVPFKVTSFLYLSSPTIKYYVIVPSLEDEQASAFFDSLPPMLNKAMYTIEDYNNGDILFENDLGVRFIFYNVASAGSSFNLPPGFQGLDKVPVSGLNIDLSDKNNPVFQFLKTNTATTLNAVGDPVPFYEDPVLYGAVFSDSLETFNCVMKKAYARLNVLSRVYLEKLNALAPLYEGSSCEGVYLDNVYLKGLITATEDYPPDYGAIGDSVASLEQWNTKLQLQSCPLIY